MNYESDDSAEFDNLVVAGSTAAVAYYDLYLNKKPCRTSTHTGYHFIMDVLNGSGVECYELFRIKKNVFLGLLDHLKEHYGLTDSKELRAEEALGIFLMIVGLGHSNKSIQNRFQRLGETVNRKFEELLNIFCAVSIDIIAPPDPMFTKISPRLRTNNRYWSYFKNCIGAIDGTHIPIVIAIEDQVPYIGRKGYPTQNVMAVCNIDMLFTFLYVGWQGAAHDARIFDVALHDPSLNFPHPPEGKYYGVDAGYPNMNGYLAPYKGERYHLPDFRRGSRARGMQEIFNYRHSSRKSVIERSFGVWKSKFRILKNMPSYPWEKQKKIVAASMAIHNFIRLHAIDDADFRKYENTSYMCDDEDNDGDSAEENNDADGLIASRSDDIMARVRDEIAMSLMSS